MTGRDAARDELAKLLGDLHASLPMEWDSAADYHRALADALIERGYRRSVTPTEFDAAVVDVARWQCTHSTLPRCCADCATRVAARAFGLEVTE